MKGLFRACLLTILFSLCSGTAMAASFETGIETGFLKQNAISTEHFRIEFSNLLLDQSDTDGDGIPNIVENVADYSEESWDEELGDMNYEAPVPFGDKLTLILDDRNEYLFVGAVGVTTLLSDGETPVIAVDPWVSDEILQVTLSHELFHSIQFGYDPTFAGTFNSINFAEATAVWMEDQVFDDVDDYLLYLTDFFTYPDYSVFGGIVPEGTLFEYALNIWPTFLSEYYNDSKVLEIWENYFFNNSISNYNSSKIFDSVREAVEDQGDLLSEVFQEFSLWNLDLGQYEEGENYPAIFALTDPEFGDYTLIDESIAPALYSTNYLYFENFQNEASFYFHVLKPEDIGMAISIVPVANGLVQTALKRSVILGPEDEMEEELILEAMTGKDGVYAIVSPVFDDLNPSTAGEDVFDEGYLYYYAGDYGTGVMDGADLVLEGSTVKEGEDAGSSDDVRIPEALNLRILDYDEDSVTLDWDRLTDAEIVGYEVLYGDASGEYTETESVDKAYVTTATVDGLSVGSTVYFQVIAVDADGDQVDDESLEVAVTPEEWIFTDVSYLDEHFEAIDSLTTAGVFEGYANGSFQPEREINRAELLKIFVEGTGVDPSATVYKNCFPDVGTEWFARYVCYAKAKGWVQGYPNGTFRPGNLVNKVEALKMLFEVYGAGLTEGLPVSSLVYPDLSKTAWYSIYVWKASVLGILEESPGENFHPTYARTRGEMAEELYRYLVKLGQI